MKRRTLQAMLVCIGLSLSAVSQETNKAGAGCGCSFSSINQVGLLEGSNRSSFQAQTINGLKMGGWFAGLGVGLDKYRFRTVPLFFDLRRDILRKLNTPFVYGDIGVHIPWVMDKEKGDWGESSFNTGLYYDAGVGYKLQLGKNRGLLFSGGVSLKKIRETRSFGLACITQPCPDAERFDFSLRRFSLKAGLQL